MASISQVVKGIHCSLVGADCVKPEVPTIVTSIPVPQLYSKFSVGRGKALIVFILMC